MAVARELGPDSRPESRRCSARLRDDRMLGNRDRHGRCADLADRNRLSVAPAVKVIYALGAIAWVLYFVWRVLIVVPL